MSLLLALCMALTLLSVRALAAPGDEDKPDTPRRPHRALPHPGG